MYRKQLHEFIEYKKKMKKMQNPEERVIKNVNKGLLKPVGACISGK